MACRLRRMEATDPSPERSKRRPDAKQRTLQWRRPLRHITSRGFRPAERGRGRGEGAGGGGGEPVREDMKGDSTPSPSADRLPETPRCSPPGRCPHGRTLRVALCRVVSCCVVLRNVAPKPRSKSLVSNELNFSVIPPSFTKPSC